MVFKKNEHSIASVFILLLLTIFVLLAILIISFGSQIYNETVSNMDTSYNSRISYAYLTQKIRLDDATDSIAICNINNQNVLCLYSTVKEYTYVTYLYEYDGYLCEYFTRSDLDFDFSFGNQIFSLYNLSFSFLEDDLLEIKYLDNVENEHILYFTLHTRSLVNV